MAEVSFTHAHDRAVVLFAGELDWKASHELVETIETVVQNYFYKSVEVVIASPGGDVRAFAYYCGAIGAWRDSGVHFTTRVFATAASSAAIMVSMGDERIADPGALLGYHHSRLDDASGITAKRSIELHAALRESDDCMVGVLVDRALADRDTLTDVPYEADRSDREVLERLSASLPSFRFAKGSHRRPYHRLAQLLGRHVERAIRAGNRKALEELYARLFELEILISARFALTLRLVDRVETSGVQDCMPPGTLGLEVPEWASLFPPGGEVSREVLTRHLLVLGETGSGKTISALLPVVAAMARAPAGRIAGALVLDPKLELGPALERLAPKRLHHVRADRAAVNLMSGPRWSLEVDLRAERWQSAAITMLGRACSLAWSSTDRVVMDQVPGTGNCKPDGMSLAARVLAFILMITSPDAEAPEAWLCDDVEALRLINELVTRARGTSDARGPNLLAIAVWTLEGPLLDPPSSPSRGWLFGRIAKALLSHIVDAPGEPGAVLRGIVEFWQPMARTHGQYPRVRAAAIAICADFATPAIATTLYFGCEPGYDTNSVDFSRIVSREAPGTLVLFQPATDGVDRLVAVALKALFLESVFDDPDRARGGADLPLVCYVADACERYITSDPLHGEQSFLDNARSFGACCVLASHSVTRLNAVIETVRGSSGQHERAKQIWWDRIASKLVFRTTDPQTARLVADCCPCRPDLPRVVRVRPVPSLRAGECYAALSDGRFERAQLRPFDMDGIDDPSQLRLFSGPVRVEVDHD